MLEPSAQPYSEPSPSEPAGSEPLNLEQALANLTHSDVSLRYYAAWWLGKFAAGEPRVVDALILALSDEADRTEMGGYPLRRNAARALGKLGDRRAVPALLHCLDCSDFYVREAAAQSLGMLGDPVCIPALLRFLEGGVEANQMVSGRPHLAQPAEAAMEALESLQATEAVPLIEPFLNHPVQRVQHAAARAMYVLTQTPAYGERLVLALSDADLKLRRSLLLDLGASGYLLGADVIAHAAVESSFKIIALKSLLESHFKQLGAVTLSSPAKRVMALMDALL
ncbi:HEAT repeat domain-containing protein [Oculatella sp. LEGE 06141]|uniref:HEAT repeat domain-containing protein n=1 Tax=Oculatella sp. LEGE 06141 TaxID=1828648 RepID=UPI00187E3A6D|nr:HEAT repeat domain-containing protein [Oculatella sp. LEGE 06141]MBE9182138.1 HEAT repeat domain-containing protein [Oculatella sp. LEGE 06141]